MSAIYDEKSGAVFISAHELCAYTLRGGDIDSRGFKNGNKNGMTVASHQMRPPKPNRFLFYRTA